MKQIKSKIAISAAGLCLLMLLYVLSLGPAGWLYKHEMVSGRAVRVFYDPIYRVGRANDKAGKLMGWYLSVWGGDAPVYDDWKGEGWGHG